MRLGSHVGFLLKIPLTLPRVTFYYPITYCYYYPYFLVRLFIPRATLLRWLLWVSIGRVYTLFFRTSRADCAVTTTTTTILSFPPFSSLFVTYCYLLPLVSFGVFATEHT
ncbi:hypothetical protein F4819DRAFT_445832 [Hypoxylon fuscum]|nr:hypothetical protein F4819DRAFT_445832 [Hypoxylon fuscum]